MNIATEAYGTGKTIDSIHAELIQLEEKYGSYLKQESLVEEVAALRKSIEESMKGSPEAADYLREYGHVVLHSIRETLDAAVAEQQRIVEESPTADDATGEKAHSISRASALVADAESELDSALDEG